jgi:hypothetical protein
MTKKNCRRRRPPVQVDAAPLLGRPEEAGKLAPGFKRYRPFFLFIFAFFSSILPRKKNVGKKI